MDLGPNGSYADKTRVSEILLAIVMKSMVVSAAKKRIVLSIGGAEAIFIEEKRVQNHYSYVFLCDIYTYFLSSHSCCPLNNKIWCLSPSGLSQHDQK